MTKNTAKTIEERIAETHVKALNVDTVAMSAITNIFRVSVMFRSMAEKEILSRYNLSFSGFTVLWVLWVWGKKQSFELSQECGIAKGTLTGIVRTLEKHALVESLPHESDSRRKYIQLTDSCQHMIEEIFISINQLESAFVADLSEAEARDLSRKLRAILNTMDKAQQSE